MTQDKARKKQARDRAAETGESYSRSARLTAQATGAPAGFTASDGMTWAQIVQYLDDAETHLDITDDPYLEASAFQARAGIYYSLAASTSEPVYAAACARAALQDETSAARIRFTNGIPTLTPRTEAARLGLNTCDWCGRPWQANGEGACPHCPRLLFGPSPRSIPESAELGQGFEAAPISSRREILDVLAVAFETDGGGCEHNADASCSDCLAEVALQAFTSISDDRPSPFIREDEERDDDPEQPAPMGSWPDSRPEHAVGGDGSGIVNEATVSIEAVRAVLEQHPDLCEHGWVRPSRRGAPRYGDAEHAASRTEMLSENSIDGIRRAVEYLSGCQILGRATRRRCLSSYGLKHRAESRIGYTTNGAFIVAALLAKVPMRVDAGPNPVILVVPAFTT